MRDLLPSAVERRNAVDMKDDPDHHGHCRGEDMMVSLDYHDHYHEEHTRTETLDLPHHVTLKMNPHNVVDRDDFQG